MRSSEERATSIPNATGRGAQPAAPIPATARALALLRLMRPQQWVKNLLVYLALIFARRVTDLPAVGRVTVAFIVFCLAASAIYILNDLMDRERAPLRALRCQLYRRECALLALAQACRADRHLSHRSGLCVAGACGGLRD